jgi:endonuclease/exonuclease/phosphatase (EEP) superfamily protein YafD
VNFVGVHPTPPGLMDSIGDARRDSQVRDAELILIAKEIANRSDEVWIVADDFNDVAWSHTTRLFNRISGLLDPRVGRTFMGTYMADYPPYRCPIDHVFLSEGFTLGSLARKKITGSDHFTILATVSLSQPQVGVTPVPQGDDRKDARQIVEEGMKDAEDRDLG